MHGGSTSGARGKGSHSRRRDTVDLKFTSDGTTLLVELKLEAGYGKRQIDRYLQWKPPKGKGALVAITKHPPLYGEPPESTHNWLGSVRWGEIYGALGELPIANRDLRRQWKLFLEVLDHSGDVGVTKLDWDLLRTRIKRDAEKRGEQRRFILEGLWAGWVEDLRQAVAARYGGLNRIRWTLYRVPAVRRGAR